MRRKKVGHVVPKNWVYKPRFFEFQFIFPAKITRTIYVRHLSNTLRSSDTSIRNQCLRNQLSNGSSDTSFLINCNPVIEVRIFFVDHISSILFRLPSSYRNSIRCTSFFLSASSSSETVPFHCMQYSYLPARIRSRPIQILASRSMVL